MKKITNIMIAAASMIMCLLCIVVFISNRGVSYPLQVINALFGEVFFVYAISYGLVTLSFWKQPSKTYNLVFLMILSTIYTIINIAFSF